MKIGIVLNFLWKEQILIFQGQVRILSEDLADTECILQCNVVKKKSLPLFSQVRSKRTDCKNIRQATLNLLY